MPQLQKMGHILKFLSQLKKWVTLKKNSQSSARANKRVHVQNLRDFPQTKLDNGINSPFLLNEHGDPRFFLQAFAKNSVIKNIYEEEKKFDSRT